jgi:hypothetical protein
MSLGDLQACPWCPFVGTPRLFDLHMEKHEQDNLSWIQDRIGLRKQDNLIVNEILAERVRQDDKWGEQNHPDGTNTKWAVVADGMKAKCESKARDGKLTFRDIFEEEIWEAYAEVEPDKLRAELVQCAAVLVNWIGAIDRRRKN